MKNENQPLSLTQRVLAWFRRPFGRKHTHERTEPNLQNGSVLARLHSVPAPVIRASVIIPALNEGKNIAQVVRYALADPATAEVIVIDDSSIDDTAVRAAHAGAMVVRSSMLGKGRSMWDGLQLAQEECLVYLDGDLSELRANIVSDLARPLATDQADFVKAAFGRSSGRVTELTAKPMLKLFFPELARVKQPLGGIIAVRKSLMQTLHLDDGYGVDIGLLIDAHRAGARVQEIDIGSLKHESQTLQGLSAMAQEVGRVIFDRAKRAGRLSVDQILSVYELDRQNQSDIDFALQKVRKHDRIVLLALEGVVCQDAYERTLAKATGRDDKIESALTLAAGEPVATLQSLAHAFRFVHQSEFDAAAHALPIREGVIECVNQLRRRGYAVGLVSDRFFSVAEIVRRRIFADFAIAHTVTFETGVCQGVASVNRAFGFYDGQDAGCKTHPHCASNVVHHLRHGERDVPLAQVIAVGLLPAHQCLLETADHAFTLASAPRMIRYTQRVNTLDDILALVRHVDALNAHVKVA